MCNILIHAFGPMWFCPGREMGNVGEREKPLCCTSLVVLKVFNSYSSEREREKEKKKKGIYYSILSYSRLLVSFGFLFRFTSLLVLLLFFLFSLPAEKVR